MSQDNSRLMYGFSARLCAGDDVILLRKDVHQLALALIAPLRPQHRRHLSGGEFSSAEHVLRGNR
jgi:hypothetical protein